jgi:hypothetical protein
MKRESKSGRRLRAVEQGATARSCGLDIEENPYQKSEWGLGGFWEMGYTQQVERERRGLAVAHPKFR